MMNAFDRFGLLINDRVVRTPVAVASMAGIVDADYLLARKDHIGLGFIGGYSIDAPTIEAAKVVAADDGRKEFITEDPITELKAQIARMGESNVILGINLRGSSSESFSRVAHALGDKVVYEIDAHCRQPALVAAGCGEYYLKNTGKLSAAIRALKEENVTVSVKIRAGVAEDDRALAELIWAAGADILHIDLMDFGTAKLRQIRNSCPLIIIANNGITTFERMKDMLSHGADMVSVARKSDERTLAGLDAAITRYADEEGWYNAPKQLCRGGDIRSLTFCCMPVKECPLIPMLSRTGISHDDFVKMKLGGVADTPLDTGRQTCFGSLAWCCKTSSPCMFRDMTLKQAGIPKKEYMRLKRELSDTIMAQVFHDVPPVKRS
ncbi:methanogenesis marker 9 domain-containing protein [Methanoregula sp.]|uniref:methanogenesis marker 9 domain-containing protein n=1 Tax=Methanoregula sp. TaxID=2052170 RepID=UPI000CB3F9EE|nr:methanogenesis marker 9 domain-containing protein [Methanoregula sp.]PKG32559.1 MAG: methanogenesis marker 9 domain-containing protein [Methanoregula sp.]